MPVFEAIEITGNGLRPGDTYREQRITAVDQKRTNVTITFSNGTRGSVPMGEGVTVERPYPTWAEKHRASADLLDVSVSRVMGRIKEAEAGTAAEAFRSHIAGRESAAAITEFLRGAESRWEALHTEGLWQMLGAQIRAAGDRPAHEIMVRFYDRARNDLIEWKSPGSTSTLVNFDETAKRSAAQSVAAHWQDLAMVAASKSAVDQIAADGKGREGERYDGD